MKSFSVDLYIFYEKADLWLFIPPYSSKVNWSIELSQSEILSCEAGATFRVDDVLWLGNERDSLPLEVLISDLNCTISKDPSIRKDKVRINCGGVQYVEFRRDQTNQMLLSRLSVDREDDYLEQTAKFVGTYYKDFPVEQELWEVAVQRSLDGLALIFSESEADVECRLHPLARWLMDRSQNLRD